MSVGIKGPEPGLRFVTREDERALWDALWDGVNRWSGEEVKPGHRFEATSCLGVACPCWTCPCCGEGWQYMGSVAKFPQSISAPVEHHDFRHRHFAGRGRVDLRLAARPAGEAGAYLTAAVVRVVGPR